MTTENGDSPRSSLSSILENVSSEKYDHRAASDDEDDRDEFFADDEEQQRGDGYQPIGEATAAIPRHSKRRRALYWLGVTAACLMFFIVLGGIVSTSKKTALAANSPKKKLLSFADMRQGKFQPHSKNIEWIDTLEGDKPGRYLVQQDGGWFTTSWFDQRQKKIILNHNMLEIDGQKYFVDSLELNKQQDKAILKTEVESNWRHSSFANYFILDVESQKITPVNPDDPHTKLSLAKWSPRGDRVAFVSDNNLHLRYVDGKGDGKVKQITKDGGEQIFYGRPDWVYEEEVFSGPDALWWSHSGEYLAFLRTNETLVPEFPISYFTDPDHREYPKTVNIKYPKPGYPNPTVSILFLEIESEDVYPVSTEEHPVEDDLITEVVWAGSNQVLVRMTSRESDIFKMSLINAESRTGKIVRREDLGSDGWFEVTHDLTYIPKDDSKGRPQDGYIDTIVVDGYNHMAYFTPLDAQEPRTILTHGEWEVDNAPSAVNLETNTVYFIGTKKNPVERHLYSVKLDASNFTAITNTTSEGHYSASFSPNAHFCLLSYKGPKVPWQKVLYMKDDDPVEEGHTIEHNEDLLTALEEYSLPEIKYSQIQMDVDADGNPVMANAMEILPPDFVPTKKYPVLFHVYGGPVSQTVSKQFRVDFQKIMPSHGVIVVIVDGRGTGMMGRKFRSVVRDNLGVYEPQDQITAAQQWASRSYVDENNIAIWGWSYGGYMTLKTLETDAGNTFKYGMAVAPVTDWRFYDSIYTERYMHTPENNKDGYFHAKINNVTALSHAERFLIMHGTGDDNVHLQHTLTLLDKFDQEEVENYDVHIFPDSDHSIYHNHANTIVYDKLESWILNAFAGRLTDLAV